ncbi:MAG: metallophosphoesterase [Kiritimatiellae bacterium]|nr:metallophosphoesterase [Kiritimatiellia bacterium]
MSISVNRRGFIGGFAAVAASAATANAQQAAEAKIAAERPAGEEVKPSKLIASAPVLQNAAETSMGVSFAVSADASGWVDVSRSPDMSGSVRVFSGGSGMMDVNDKVALVRIRGLKPATRYWYRIGADRIDYAGGYKMKNLGSEVDEKVHSFMTLGAGANGGSFCVINDTHERKPVLDQVFTKIKELNPSVVIWNGDASNCSETIDRAMDVFIRPHEGHPEYAADTPYMFVNGNHDFRGRFNRRLCDLMMFREPRERDSKFAELGRNFVQRLGDIALIGLDTGEDKLDTNRHFAGIFRMAEYRELQTRWLAEAIETPAVREARFKVAFCHIPLFEPRPGRNPGDIAPDDESPLYKNNWASWQRTCANLWGPLFVKAGVQLVVCAHQHCFRYNPPEPGRPWAHIVGGGCNGVNKNKNLFPTVIEGKVVDGKLSITVHDVLYKRIALQETFG